MKYISGRFDQLVDVERILALLARAGELPEVKLEIERQIRNYLLRCRTKAKQEQAILARGEVVCEFRSYQEWVNKARSWLGGISGGGVRYKRRERVVCVDSKDRICRRGLDFMRARDEGTFPVRAYRTKK